MAKVIGLRGHPIPKPLQPDLDLVKKLESLLERAKSGKARGIAYVVFEFDQTWATCWGGEGTAEAFLGGVAMLQYRLAQDIAGDDHLA